MENFKVVPGRKLVKALTLGGELLLIPINPPLEMLFIKVRFGKCLLDKIGHLSVSRHGKRMTWRLCELVRLLGVMHSSLPTL